MKLHNNTIYTERFAINQVLSQHRFQNPWLNPDLILQMETYLNAKAILIEHNELDQSVAIGIFFTEEKQGLRVLYSGGRFGFFGFENLVNKICTEECAESLIVELRNAGFSSISIRWDSIVSSNLRAPGHLIPEAQSGSVTERNYFVTNISETIRDSKLIFTQSQVRNNLTRNIKKSYGLGLQFHVTTNLDDIHQWYLSCHLVRMSELGSRGWGFDFFRTLMLSQKGVLFSVTLEEELIGGSFCILSDGELEIIMMSTPYEYLQKSINYFMTNEIYIWSENQGIKFVNWQASNPPQGGVAQFKQSWNAQNKLVSIYSFRLPVITDDLISELFPDKYIHPFIEGAIK